MAASSFELVCYLPWGRYIGWFFRMLALVGIAVAAYSLPLPVLLLLLLGMVIWNNVIRPPVSSLFPAAGMAGNTTDVSKLWGSKLLSTAVRNTFVTRDGVKIHYSKAVSKLSVVFTRDNLLS